MDRNPLSELFMLDAEQLVTALQRHASAARGASPAATAVACEALADLLRTLDLLAYAGCVRALARSLSGTGSAPDEPERRALVDALASRLVGVVGSMRLQQPVDDGQRFARDWMARLQAAVGPSRRPAPEAPLSPQAAALVFSLDAWRAGSTPAMPSGAVDDAAALAADLAAAQAADAAAQAADAAAQAADAAAQAARAAAVAGRATALSQAASLHQGLPHTQPAARPAIERVIADLVAQARLTCPVLAGWPLSPPLAAAPEAWAALAEALALLPAAQALRASAAAAVLTVDLDGVGLTAAGCDAAGALIGRCGGRIDATPRGLRLRLPRDTCLPEVRVLRCAQGWFAVHALQVDEPGAAAPGDGGGLILRNGLRWHRLPGGEGAAEPVAALWRHALPAARAWPKPVDWQALVADASGRLMPLRVPEPAVPRSAP